MKNKIFEIVNEYLIENYPAFWTGGCHRFLKAKYFFSLIGMYFLVWFIPSYFSFSESSLIEEEGAQSLFAIQFLLIFMLYIFFYLKFSKLPKVKKMKFTNNYFEEIQLLGSYFISILLVVLPIYICVHSNKVHTEKIVEKYDFLIKNYSSIYSGYMIEGQDEHFIVPLEIVNKLNNLKLDFSKYNLDKTNYYLIKSIEDSDIEYEKLESEEINKSKDLYNEALIKYPNLNWDRLYNVISNCIDIRITYFGINIITFFGFLFFASVWIFLSFSFEKFTKYFYLKFHAVLYFIFLMTFLILFSNFFSLDIFKTSSMVILATYLLSFFLNLFKKFELSFIASHFLIPIVIPSLWILYFSFNKEIFIKPYPLDFIPIYNGIGMGYWFFVNLLFCFFSFAHLNKKYRYYLNKPLNPLKIQLQQIWNF